LTSSPRAFGRALTIGLGDLLSGHMTIVLLAAAVLVSLGVVAMCSVCRER
jgi:hypothetical protein